MYRILHNTVINNIATQQCNSRLPYYLKHRRNISFTLLRCSLSFSSKGVSSTCLGNAKTILKKNNFLIDNHDKILPFGFQRRFISVLRKYSVLPKYRSCLLQTARTLVYVNSSLAKRTMTSMMYLSAVFILVVGLSYAAVPFYRLFCQTSGYGGTTKKVELGDTMEAMERIEDRPLSIQFHSHVNAALRWTFEPQQREVKLVPGETALAFYTAKNLTDRTIIGIATYNVLPFEAGKYFNKIQCFCFEEQQLNPHEEVDMPVFFYIDPEFDEDPEMAKYDSVILAYTFFESEQSAHSS